MKALRVLNAMVDIAADNGLLIVCLRLMQLTQMVVQGRSTERSTLRQLPYCNTKAVVNFFGDRKNCSPTIHYLPQLMALPSSKLSSYLAKIAGLRKGNRIAKIVKTVCSLPSIDLNWTIEDDNGQTISGGVSGRTTSTKPSARIARLSEDDDYEVSDKSGVTVNNAVCLYTTMKF